MHNRNHRTARILILIPIAVLIVTAICMGLATILEYPTDMGLAYTVFAFIGIMSMFLYVSVFAEQNDE